MPLARPETDLLRLDAGEEALDAGPAPLPAAETRLVMETGTVRLKSPLYVEREADRSGEPIGQPIEGDPDALLEDWLQRLALRFDEDMNIVPRWPVASGGGPR